MGDQEDQAPAGVPVLTAAVGATEDVAVPVLTSVVDTGAPAAARLSDEELLALRSRLASATRDLAERLLEEAMSELEMALFERVSARLREQLPDMLEQALRDHFDSAD